MHHLILGAGPAGVIAAETIRRQSAQDPITIVGDEREAPYSRMAIPYLLIGKIGESGTWLRKGAGYYDRLGIKLLRDRATAVDATARMVTMASGQQLGFDTLLIATGSTPLRPPIPGIELPGVHPCWTLEDARHIMALAVKGARVLQMGAGFIGCIIMEALAARGVQVFTGTRVEAISPGTPLSVRLSSGQKIDADLVISATGVKPTIGFLRESGIRCQHGVLTDARMQTSVAGIYAAGDCAEAFDKFTGHHVVSAIQPNAAEEGRVAGLNMAGQAAQLPGVTQINVLDTLGLVSASFGEWQGVPGGEQVELTDRGAGRHLNLQFRGDVMVGCNSVGWTDHVGVLRGLVEGQVRLGAWKDRLKQDPTRLMEAYLASAQAQNQWRGALDARRR
jgi:NAD(P)H-nitrite reductase large subunit